MIAWTVLAATLLAVAFVLLLQRLASRLDAGSCTPDWLNDFSMEAYDPMPALFDRADFDFLARQPGYRPEIGRRLLAERRKVFRAYLRLLTRDFNQLLALAKLAVVYSSEDRPEFASALWREQIRFYCAVSAAWCRVQVFSPRASALDVRKLLNPVERLCDQVRSLALYQAEPVA